MMQRSAGTYRPEIDGLRAFAVLAVVFYHASLVVFGYMPFQGGFLGVDIFFVISGYLIAGILLREMESGAFTFSSFYERRARRILPVLFFVIFVSLPFAWLGLLPDNFLGYAKSIIATVLSASNFVFWLESGYFDTPGEIKPLIHTWSLGVEEQFYLLFPVTLLLIWKHARRYLTGFLLCGFVVSLLLADWGSRTHPDANFFLLPARIWELMVGAIIARLERSRGDGIAVFSAFMPFIGILLIIASIAFFDEQNPHPSFYTLAPVLGTALIIWFGGKGDIISNILSLRAVVGLGLISYSLYLWHQPMFAFARVFKTKAVHQDQYLLLILLALMLSFLSWRFIEKPFRDARKVSTRSLWMFSAVGTAFFLMAGGAGVFAEGFPDRFNALEVLASKVRYQANVLKQQDRSCNNRDVKDACIFNGADGSPVWYVVGDSHAATLLPALYSRIRRLRHGLIPLTTNGCLYVSDSVRRSKGKCTVSVQKERRELLLSAPPGIVVVHGRLTRSIEGHGFNNGEGGVETGSDPAPQEEMKEEGAVFGKSIVSSVEDLLKHGHRVIVIYPAPEVGWNVPQTLPKVMPTSVPERRKWLAQGGLTTSWDVFKSRNKRAYETYDAIGDSPNLLRVYPERIFCNTVVADRCITHGRSEVYYSDDDHLSEAGANLLIDEVIEQAKAEWGF